MGPRGKLDAWDISHRENSMKPQFLLAVAPVVLSFTAFSSASAQALHVRTPINFTLSGCTQLPDGLTVNGSGESFVVLTSRLDKDGNIVMERNDLVTGTAIDSNGNSYGFNYHNHSTITVPPAGLPFTVSTTDHFNLVGNGKPTSFRCTSLQY